MMDGGGGGGGGYTEKKIGGVVMMGAIIAYVSAASTFIAAFFWGCLLLNQTKAEDYPTTKSLSDQQIIDAIAWNHDLISQTITSFFFFFVSYGMLLPVGEALKLLIPFHQGLQSFFSLLITTTAICGSGATLIQMAAQLSIWDGYERYGSATMDPHRAFTIHHTGNSIQWAGEFLQLIYHGAFALALIFHASISFASKRNGQVSIMGNVVALINAAGQLILAMTLISYRVRNSRQALGVIYIIVQGGAYPLWLAWMGTELFVYHARYIKTARK